MNRSGFYKNLLISAFVVAVSLTFDLGAQASRFAGCDSGGPGAESCSASGQGSSCEITCCEGYACCSYDTGTCECNVWEQFS